MNHAVLSPNRQGMEMLAAMEEADGCGARVVHGDRPQQATMASLKTAFSQIPGGPMGEP